MHLVPADRLGCPAVTRQSIISSGLSAGVQVDVEPGPYALPHWRASPVPASLLRKAASNLEIPALPAGVSVQSVYAHLMGYAYRHTSDYFARTSLDGARL